MKNVRKLAVVVLLGVAVFGVAATSGSESSDGSKKSSGDSASKDATGGAASSGNSSSGSADELDDVKVTACGNDDVLGPKATLAITNDSSDPSDYIIEVSFESPDGKTNFGTGNAIVQRLAQGQTKNEDVSSLGDKATGEIVCKVTKVDRTASL